MKQTIRKNWGETHIPDQTGKTVLVTGANIGLGYETARMLAGKGAHVLMACRNEARGAEALDAIRTIHGDARLDLVSLDLADLDSVAKLPAALREAGISTLDVLVNNAGIMMPPKRQTTKQGFEAQFGINHLGHFALTRSLFDMLSPDARIVTVSSGADRVFGINFDDLQWEANYSPQKAYGQSKTANLLFTYELTRRLKAAGSHIKAVAAHPGMADTNLSVGSTFSKWVWVLKLMRFMRVGPQLQTPEMGALPQTYAATDEIESGAYYGPEEEYHGHPIRADHHRAEHSTNPEYAVRLWEVSERLTEGAFSI
ncbi:MAG: oxidoreductase [Pseudomonadota bacterium]